MEGSPPSVEPQVVRREVRTVTLIFDDGTIQTFDPVRGFYHRQQNYHKGAKTPDEAFTEHSVRWES